MTNKAHNAASEFARAVRASSPLGHAKKLAGKYSTPTATALALLGLKQFNGAEPIKSWRRGQCAPAGWAIESMRDALEELAEACYAESERLRQAKGPGHAGAAGTRALHAYRANQSAQKEKAAARAALEQK
jgi:hypothetical protein